MGEIVEFKPKAQQQKQQPAGLLLATPSHTTLNKLTQALQAVLFLEEDREGAEAILAGIAAAVKARRQEVTLTDPAALRHRRYFDYMADDWHDAHRTMYEYTASV